MKIFHTAISVNSIKESRSFYEKVFGLKFRVAGERPELGVTFIMLQDEHGVVIELFEHVTPTGLTEDLMDFSKVGIKHIAFVVEDMEKIIEQAIKLGSKIIWSPRKGVTVKKIAFISDPNNIPIELVEY